MSTIRKKSLKATFWIYSGFLIGAINTYLLTHKNWFTTDQNGLTRIMIEISQLIYAFSIFGVTTYLFKFFPYYKDNAKTKENDLLGIALIVACTGFLITAAALFLAEPIIVRKFSANSILLVEYFYWTIPMAFFVLLYNILEAYAYGFERGVLTSLLRETILRLYTCGIILLKVLGLIEFETFIILFSFQFLLIVLVLAFYLYRQNELWITFRISRVTRKYRRKIIAMMALTFMAIIVQALRGSIDGLILASIQNLGKVGIFGLASYMVAILQAPFRSLVAVTIPILSRSWKKKDYREIDRIYKRSSINLLTFTLFVFVIIWLNYEHAIILLNINADYLAGKWVFFLLGMVAIVEMGTGMSGQIIGTSVYWRFELMTSILLTAMIIPLSYYLTISYGIIGPAIANLVSFTVYNAIRYFFLWKKFGMQPFSSKTAEVILIALAAFTASYFVTKNLNHLPAMLVNISIFSLLFLSFVYFRDITPDLKPVLQTMKRRIRR